MNNDAINSKNVKNNIFVLAKFSVKLVCVLQKTSEVCILGMKVQNVTRMMNHNSFSILLSSLKMCT